jgi:hypothetical protein
MEHTHAIERVPALFVSQLLAQGILPAAPEAVIASAHVPERRDMTIQEAAALTWVICGPFHRPRGVAAYRDVFDYHVSADVREVIHIAGSRRAVVSLARFLRDDARTLSRRCVGTMDLSNKPMIHLLGRGGCAFRRIRWESE